MNIMMETGVSQVGHVAGVSHAGSGAAPIVSQTPRPTDSRASDRALHRLGEVRRRERLSRRKLAQFLGISAGQVKKQEEPTADLLLSDLYRWQKALEVPIGELLQEPAGELAAPVQLRARLLRAMKTVRSIQRAAQQVSIRRLATMLVEQLVEVMPELKGTAPWPASGHRRSHRIEPLDWHLVFERRWT